MSINRIRGETFFVDGKEGPSTFSFIARRIIMTTLSVRAHLLLGTSFYLSALLLVRIHLINAFSRGDQAQYSVLEMGFFRGFIWDGITIASLFILFWILNFISRGVLQSVE